jgi:hypothetical protein
MKSYELKPTRENILDAILRDTIGRNKDVFAFADILNSLEDSCSIAIDGSWGSGKTFFVNQVKMFLDANNSFVSSMSEDDQAVIISAWKTFHKNSDPEYQPHISVYYDAWENDNDQDPVLSLVYAILKNVDADFSVPKDVGFVKIAANILEFFTGKNWNDLIDGFRSEDPLDELKKAKTIEKEIKCFLDKLLEERGNRLVVFIDELDRCKPSYAVRLLERIKHYFENDRITFVFSINTNELQHTIKRYYGEDFDACRYLDRFFDIRMSLPPIDTEAFYKSIDFNSSRYLYDIICHSVICRYNFSIRETAKYLRLMRMTAYDATHDNVKGHSFAFAEGKATKFCLLYIIPIMIGLKFFDAQRYDDFIHGRDASPLLEFTDVSEYIFNKLLARGESYEAGGDDVKVVTVAEKLEAVYDALFKTTYDGAIYHKYVGRYEFNKQNKELILRIASLFSRFTEL